MVQVRDSFDTAGNFRVVNADGVVVLTTTSDYTAMRLATTSAAFRGEVQMLVFGEWVAVDRAAADESLDSELVGRAEALARRAHRGQTDKAGNDYIEHPARVAAAVAGAREQVVAWLHDAVEDTAVTLGEIEAAFGSEIAADIDAITHRRGEPRPEYYERVKARPVARTVKLADIADNSNENRLALLDVAQQDRLRSKYAKARQLLGA